MSDKPKTQNIFQFAKERGLVTTAEVDSHIHAGLRSAPPWKTYRRWYFRRLRELQDARDETVRLYRAAVASGEIIEPPKPTMEEIAQGCPDNAAVQAAKRCIEKRRLRALGLPIPPELLSPALRA